MMTVIEKKKDGGLLKAESVNRARMSDAALVVRHGIGI